MNKPQDSFIHPSFRRTSAGHRKIDGVQFHSYRTGILTYAMISEDGQIMVQVANAHRDGAPTYFAKLIGHGYVRNASGNTKRFQSEHAAYRAAVKAFKERIES